ncbi:minor head protein (endogenous virus) [Lactococcus phage KSY1]|uniref:Gp064 n=1 Tax=Lactococcus phage KSY1 TaxID=2913972 RepID=A6MAC9_9CAUD|nr:minor head protein [Lactococcus phage KSY1]ABG21607.1 gp064 [Lactococcus phage KSY1]
MTDHFITLSTTELISNAGIVKLRHADVNSQNIVAQIVENGQPKNFEGLQPFFCLMAQEVTGQGVTEESVRSFDAKKGTLTYTPSDNALQFVGRNEAYFSFRSQVGDQWVEQFSTRTFHYIVEKSIYSQPFKDSNYWWTFKELYRIFNQYIKDGKKSWEEFVKSTREILESIDPGGALLAKVIDVKKLLMKKFQLVSSLL